MLSVVEVTGHAAVADVEGWYRRHQLELVRLAMLAVGDPHQAEEVVQDVFANVARRPPRLNDPANPLPYLRAAVLNRCRSGLLRRATGRAAVATLDRQTRPPAAVPDDEAVARATRAEVLRAVRTLPRGQRDVVLLRYWLDLGEAEIAATLGVSAGTVKTQAHRAMKTLAPLLEELR